MNSKGVIQRFRTVDKNSERLPEYEKEGYWMLRRAV
jgi:hypothetical protein